MLQTKSPPALIPEIYLIPLGSDQYVIYAPLEKSAFVCNGATVNIVDRIREEGPEKAAGKYPDLVGFLEELGMIADEAPQLPIVQYEGDFAPTHVTLFLTTACNLRCSYCYASAGETPLRSMDLERAIKGIDFVLENAVKTGKDEIRITFHGRG